MRFERYLVTEANTSGATNMESAIVDAWNGHGGSPEAEKVVAFLKTQRLSGKSEHLGSGSYPLSKEWKEYGGTDGTPKTDLVIGKNRISLKQKGGSQLMSGKQGETRATLLSALKRSGVSEHAIISDIESYLKKFVDGKNALNVSQQKKAGVVTSDIVEAEKMHKEFKKYLENLFKDKKVKDAVIHEAMTGSVKFGDSNIARATDILVFGEDGNGCEWHNTDDARFISKKSSETKLYVAWKSAFSTTKKNGKVYSYFSVLRLANGKANEEFSKYEGQPMNEGLLGNIWSNIKEFFSRIWGDIKSWLSQGWDNILAFFELEPELEMSPVVF